MGVRVWTASPTGEDLHRLAASMRAEDVAECQALAGWDPLTALQESLSRSIYARTAFFDGEVAAMWGVSPGPGPTSLLGGPMIGIAWLLTGEAVNRHPRAFLRLCLREVGNLLEQAPTLINYIDARYTRALRWAAWMGCRIGPEERIGVAGHPFRPVVLRRAQ